MSFPKAARKELNIIGGYWNLKRKYWGLELNYFYRKRLLKVIRGDERWYNK